MGAESTVSRAVEKLRYSKIRLLQGSSDSLGLAIGTWTILSCAAHCSDQFGHYMLRM